MHSFGGYLIGIGDYCAGMALREEAATTTRQMLHISFAILHSTSKTVYVVPPATNT
jgi:hypothetical protein